MDFGIEELTDIYIEKLAPLIYSNKSKRNLSAQIVYKETIAAMDMMVKAYIDRGDEIKAKEYKEDILGKNVIVTAPSDYFDLALAIDIGIPDRWDAMDLHTKARIRAQRYLSGMIDVIEKYRKNMEDRIKNNMAKPNG
jgi:hypothetical protein